MSKSLSRCITWLYWGVARRRWTIQMYFAPGGCLHVLPNCENCLKVAMAHLPEPGSIYVSCNYWLSIP